MPFPFQNQVGGGGSPRCGHHCSMEPLVPALSALTGSAFGSQPRSICPTGGHMGQRGRWL